MSLNKFFRKKALITGLATLTFLAMASSKPLNASTIGGADTTGKGKLSISIAGEYSSGRKMKNDSVEWRDALVIESEGSVPINFGGNAELKTEIKQMDTEILKVTYGLLDNLDIYGIFGMTGGEVKQTASGVIDWFSGDEASGKANFEAIADAKLKRALAYGAGIKGKMNLPKDFFLGGDVQGLFHKNKYTANAVSNYTESESGESLSSSASFGGTMSFARLQGTIYVAKKMGSVTPYVGSRYSSLSLENKTDYGETKKHKPKDSFGPIAGVGVKIGKNFMLALEGGMIGKSKEIGLEGRISF